MFMKKRKTAKSLKAILFITYLVFVLFLGSFVAYALFSGATYDGLPVIGLLLKNFQNNLLNLLMFKAELLDGVANYILSGLFYFFAFIALLYLIVGIAVGAKKKRGIVVPAIIASFLAAGAYLVIATNAGDVWGLLTSGPAIVPLIVTILFVAMTLLFIIFAYVSYFMSISEAMKNPRLAEQENAEEEPQEQPAEEPAEGQESPVAEEAPVEEIIYEEEPVVFEEITDEPAMMNEPLPEPEPELPPEEEAPVFEEEPQLEEAPVAEEEPAPAPVVEPAPAPAPQEKSDKDDLKSMLREVVRDIVRDEIARNNANQPKSDFNPLAGGTITGATFGGPLVVQYFNGGINSPAQPAAQPAPQPAPEPAKEEKPAEPAPVKEEPKQAEPEPQPEPEPEPAPAPAPVAEPAPEPQPEPAPVVEAVVAPAPAPVDEEKKPIVRIPFTERMLNADPEMQNNYNELKNEILSYGVNSRVSNSGDTFRLHRKTYIKLTIAGLSLKLYFALDPEDYKDSTLPIQNAGHKGIYSEIPLVFKVKSGLSMRRCKQLIQDVFDKNGLEQGEVRQINWVEELKNVTSQDDD